MKALEQWPNISKSVSHHEMCEEIDRLRSILELQEATIEELKYRLADYIGGTDG